MIRRWRPRRREPDEHDLMLEGLLLAIGVHGPGVVLDHMEEFRWLRDNYRHGFHQVKCALLRAGMERHQLEDILLGDKHEDDCACWRCIMRLHVAIVRRLAEMRVQDWDGMDEPSEPVLKPGNVE